MEVPDLQQDPTGSEDGVGTAEPKKRQIMLVRQWNLVDFERKR